MHFPFRKGFFSALRSLTSFRMKNDVSELDQRLGPRLNCWLNALRVYLAGSQAGKQFPAPRPRREGVQGGGLLHGRVVWGRLPIQMGSLRSKTTG